MQRKWRIFIYKAEDLYDIMEVMRKRKPTRKAKSLLFGELTPFEIYLIF